MKFAVVTLSVAVLALGLVASTAQARTKRADHHTHTGSFVSATGGKLVMTGRNGKDHTHTMAKDAKIMIDGKPGALTGLTKGMHISVTTDNSGNVTAVSTVAVTPVKAAAPKTVAPAPPAKAPAKPATSATPKSPAKTG